jgi:hypothetical protein
VAAADGGVRDGQRLGRSPDELRLMRRQLELLAAVRPLENVKHQHGSMVGKRGTKAQRHGGTKCTMCTRASELARPRAREQVSLKHCLGWIRFERFSTRAASGSWC